MRGRLRVAVAGWALAGLAAAGCGARLSDEQQAVQAGAPGQLEGPAVSGGAPRATSTTVAGGPAPAGQTPGAPGGPATTAPAGPIGEEGEPAACSPEGASDVGVSAEEVTIGQVSTISGPVPGLGQTVQNGVRAYVEYRNSIGGVCGRQLRHLTADDRLDPGVNRSETQRLSGQVLAFVGGWSVSDNGGAAVIGGSGIPDVGLAISDERNAMAENFSTSPIATDGGSGFRPILEHLIATEQPTVGAVVWVAQASSRIRGQGMVRDLEALGLPVPIQREIAVTETNYVSVAQAIENAGADIVLTATDVTGIARLAQAFDQIGYEPKVPFYGSQTYSRNFFELAGDAAEGALLGVTYAIAEDAPGNPAMATLVEWYDRVNPGADLDFFAIQGWTAAAMFADALERAGPAPTPATDLQQLQGFTDYDAGGLLAPFDPAGKAASPCFMIVEAQGGRWVRLDPPDQGFRCA